MEKIVEQIKSVVEEAISGQGDLFLVDIIKKGSDQTLKVIVLLDGDHGISIDSCVSISRQVSRYIDEEMDLQIPLTLEVSSAGVDHPLTLNRQYVKNIGKNVKITLADDTFIQGELKTVTSEFVELEVIADKKKKTTLVEKIYFEKIIKTIVLVSFK